MPGLFLSDVQCKSFHHGVPVVVCAWYDTHDMQKLFVLLVIIIAPLFVYYLYTEERGVPFLSGVVTSEMPTVRIGNVPVRVAVADTEDERAIGLSGRETLAATEGMLFVFEESAYHAIWMKDMRFPIDVIWIDERLRVVDITRDLQPDSYPRQFEPSVPARFAIEVSANYAEAFGIRVGDLVSVPAALVPEDLRN